MAVTLNTPLVPPAPTYDRVHLDSLIVSSEQSTAEKVSVSARIRLYYINASGEKVFDKDVVEVSIPDAEAWAMTLYASGDMRGAQAAGYIKSILALLVETHTAWGTTTVA